MPAPKPLLKWDKLMIARELGMDSRTVGKRLQAAELTGDRFTTQQIFAAMHGDLSSERLRLVREQADEKAIDNAKTRGELIPIVEVSKVFNRAITEIKGAIYSSANLERYDKDRIVEACGRLWDKSFGIAPADSSDVESASKTKGV